MVRILGVVCCLLALALHSGCGDRSERPEGPLTVVVSIPPLEGLVRPLLPADAVVKVLVPPGQTPHGFELAPSDVVTVANADVVVYVGLYLEPQLEKLLKNQDTSWRREVCFADVVGIEFESPVNHSGHDHGPGEECDHEHGPVDPHLWLDPGLVEQLIPELRAAVQASVSSSSGLTDAQRESLMDRESALLAKVRDVDEQYRARLEPFEGESVVTHHAAWSRLVDRYGLKEAAVIQVSGQVEPSATKMAETVETIREMGVKAVFVEPQFGRSVGDRIAQAAGVRVGVLDPLGDGDWFRMMLRNLDELESKLGGGAG